MQEPSTQEIDEQWVVRITPDAGTVKAGGFRDVPLHPQIIEQGFIEFVNSTSAGPLFHNGTDPKTYKQKRFKRLVS